MYQCSRVLTGLEYTNVLPPHLPSSIFFNERKQKMMPLQGILFLVAFSG